jgi:hypothetical protein
VFTEIPVRVNLAVQFEIAAEGGRARADVRDGQPLVLLTPEEEKLSERIKTIRARVTERDEARTRE